MPHIVLASKSPRRHELLRRMGITDFSVENDRLGKPRDEADALRMLTELAGNRHTVCTGVTVRQGGKAEAFTVSTDVYFRPCAEEELRAYIATGEPMDKAGAYGVQSLGALLVERIDGDFFNVMGLPVQKVYTELDKFLNP